MLTRGLLRKIAIGRTSSVGWRRAFLSSSSTNPIPPDTTHTTTNQTTHPSKPDNAKLSKVEVLYKMPQDFTIRTMLGITVVNAFYWSSLITNYFFFKGTMFGDIDLGGDPSWGYAGLAATGLFVYFTRHFAHHTVYQSYLSEDGRRIGFQVHNIVGNPGRKFEVSLGQAHFLDKKLTKEKIIPPIGASAPKTSLMGSSLLPVRVEGIKGNILLDQGALHQQEGKLCVLLTEPEKRQIQSKEERIEWRKGFLKQLKERKRK